MFRRLLGASLVQNLALFQIQLKMHFKKFGLLLQNFLGELSCHGGGLKFSAAEKREAHGESRLARRNMSVS